MTAARRRGELRALARLVPDAAGLLAGLVRDRRVPRRRKLLLAAAVAYLACPIDLVPDFIPVAGQLDDAAVLALALRAVLRSCDPGVLEDHWRGPAPSLALLRRLAGA